MPPKTSSVPYAPTLPGWSSVHPRPMPPIYPHPNLDSIQTPALPSRPRPHVFYTAPHGVYRLSTHLVPAAYPRIAPHIPLPEIPTYVPGCEPVDRRTKLGVLAKQLLDRQNAYYEGALGKAPSEKLLWNCVNRYVRTPASRTMIAGAGVTLFLTHANGLHKETWETMLRNLLDAPAGKMIDEVWAWDAVQHGDAAVVNAENLSGIFDWLDDSRDIANFLIHYLPEDVKTTVLPTRLPRLQASAETLREEGGYRLRKLVVVGHSFTGCTSVRVAIDFPKLFSSVVLVDPIIQRPRTYRSGHLHGMVLRALTRRDRWSSREEAFQLLKKLHFFGAWHPDVLRLYIEHALIDDAEGGVRLKAPRLQEGLIFASEVPSNETWELLERLDKRIALRWVVPKKPCFFFMSGVPDMPDAVHRLTKELGYERVWRRPANSTNVTFDFVGHLIVQEAPLELAHDITDFLLRELGSVKPHL